MLPSDLLLLRETHFTLWRPSLGGRPPVLVIGTFAAGNPNTLANRKDIPLSEAGPNLPGLWTIAAAESRLAEGIYDAGELKRSWMYGFLVRCCEEALAPA